MCQIVEVSLFPAWSMWDSLWPRECSFFPPKCFIFIIYQCFILELLIHNLIMWQHHSVKSMKHLKYKKVNVTYKTKLLRAQGTCMHFTLLYLFPSVTFSLHSWYTYCDELTFPCNKITQVTVTYYSFYVHCQRNRTQGKRMDCYLHS